MAYLQWTALAEDGGAIGTRIAAPAGSTAPASTLAPIEWQIVGLARGDGLSSLRGPGRWDRIKTLIFGERANPRLANRRLESLRRLAVDAWHHGYAVRPSFLRAFLKAGFSEGQLETLLASISARRGATISGS